MTYCNTGLGTVSLGKLYKCFQTKASKWMSGLFLPISAIKRTNRVQQLNQMIVSGSNSLIVIFNTALPTRVLS